MIIIAAETLLLLSLSSFVQHSVEIRRWILDIDRKTRRWKILQQRRRRQWWNDARIGDSLTLAALSYQQAVVVFAAMTCRVFFLDMNKPIGASPRRGLIHEVMLFFIM